MAKINNERSVVYRSGIACATMTARTMEIHSQQPPHSSAKAKMVLAAALVVVPLLLTTLVRYWSHARQSSTASIIESIVVAPSTVVGRPEDGYLRDAVAATLTAYLQGVPTLDTKRPPSGADFDRAGNDYGILANAFRVDGLILSTVTTDGELLMIDLQLADTSSKRVLWTSQYQGRRNQYIPLLRAAGEGLQRALRPEIPPVEFEGGVSSNSDAELAFREGEFEREQGNVERALAAFKRALDADRGLAWAAAEISLLHASSAGSAAAVTQWADLALRIDPACGLAFIAMAQEEQFKARPDAERRLVNALKGARLEERNPIAHKVLAAALSGAPELAARAKAEWLKLAPLDAQAALESTGPEISEINTRIVFGKAAALGQAPAYLAPLP